MAELNKEIAELQRLEQTIQGILMQKQQLQIELSEISNAIKEVSSTNGDVFRVMSGIMLKSEKSEVLKELEEKKKKANMQMEVLDKQEDAFNSRISQLRNKISTISSKK